MKIEELKEVENYIVNELNKLPLELKADLDQIIEKYKKAGKELNLVGGYVRDLLLNYFHYKTGRKISLENADLDFSTNATLEKTASMFDEYMETENSRKHGTITVILNDRHEITRYREDVSTDGRNATVKFAENCEVDLSRRDFKFNAIAFDLINMRLIDPFDGVIDIKNKEINFVGDNPAQRVLEDHLRAVRYFRFIIKYGFHYKESDKEEVFKVFDSNVLKIERIHQEMNKIREKEYIGYHIIKDLSKLNLYKRFIETDVVKDKIFKHLFSLVSENLITFEEFKKDEKVLIMYNQTIEYINEFILFDYVLMNNDDVLLHIPNKLNDKNLMEKLRIPSEAKNNINQYHKLIKMIDLYCKVLKKDYSLVKLKKEKNEEFLKIIHYFCIKNKITNVENFFRKFQMFLKNEDFVNNLFNKPLKENNYELVPYIYFEINLNNDITVQDFSKLGKKNFEYNKLLDLSQFMTFNFDLNKKDILKKIKDLPTLNK